MVSHDRYFLDNVADRIFEFDGNGHLRQYEGGYTDYLEAKQRRSGILQGEKNETGAGSSVKKNAGKDWKQNQPVKLKFSYKEQREYETIDEEIAALEEIITKLEEEILANATNSVKLNELTVQKEQKEQELEEKMERWVYLNNLAEQIENQGN